jgi:hypothetical protein
MTRPRRRHVLYGWTVHAFLCPAEHPDRCTLAFPASAYWSASKVVSLRRMIDSVSG